uniref:glutamate--tRNA ligase n=1 Tax=Odontella aurita TaxID=265563 RepID=A0A7S4J4K3_9STRA
MTDDKKPTAGSSPGEGAAVAVPDLPTLQSKIELTSNQIRDLKTAGGDEAKDKIPPLVQELLTLKKEYADNNGGIGVDGKPYEPPLSKAEKKKLEKDKKKKAAQEAAAGGGGGGGEGGEPKEGDMSKGAAKKAAKKAAAKAKKEAMKAAGQDPKAAGQAKAAARKEAKGGGDAAAAAGKAKAGGRAKGGAAAAAMAAPSKLQPGQLAFNPNVPLSDRPAAALAVACLLNGAVDLDIVSDHTRHGGPAYGLPNGGELTGDLAIARYLARTLHDGGGCVRDGAALLGEGGGAEEQGQIEQWVDYALTVSKFSLARRVRAISSTLNAALAHRTYAVGTKLTMADLALYAALGFPSQLSDAAEVTALLSDSETAPVLRWMNMLSSHPSLREATQLALGVSQSEAVFDAGSRLEPLVEGMNPLEGATPGQVVTRFPPEPSGYLHIGHAKALLLNDYYARRYKGRLIARFDDTNPSKEKEEYQSSILEDLGKLGVKPDVVTYTSDYFETIRGYAEWMIRNGLAYMDDTPQEQMQKERMDRVESAHRNQTPAEAMEHFKLMCSGSKEGAAFCLRARIDMGSVNGTMRDPVLYRQNLTPHHRSGKSYKAYPTYDLACPIVDSVEGVTHALRTTEYNDRNEQYGWIQRTLGLRRVRVQEFSRVDFRHTVLSKRKLTWFVEQGKVTGWDDPRMPTVRGTMRRGVDVEALRSFMCAQGASRRIVNMEWSKFWAENKKRIDVYSKRFMAIDKSTGVKLTVTNGPDEEERAYVSADYHPKDPSMGKRIVQCAKEVLLEGVDAEGLKVEDEIVLMKWGLVKITKVEGGLEGAHVPDADMDVIRKAKKLSWIASVAGNTPTILTEFDNLVTKEKLEEEDNFYDYVNPRTKAESTAIGDAMLRTLKEGDVIQLERRGYYRVDRPYVGPDKPLVLLMIPDGKAKPMGGLAGRLKHA